MQAGHIDALVANVPAYTWYAIAERSLFSISIGCAANATAGMNVSYLTNAYLGAGVFAYPHGIRFEPELPSVHTFRTGQELLSLCVAAHRNELPAPDPRALRDCIVAFHSHEARARQLVAMLHDLI